MADDTIPDLEALEGTIRDISPVVKYSPYTALWWQTSLINRVPETSVGWLTAQGWQVVSTYAEEDCGQTFYVMARQSMNSWYILQSLLNEYTQAYNEGRAANSIRYNDVVSFWVDAIARCRHHVDLMADQSDYNIGLYISDLNASVDEVNAAIGECESERTSEGTALATQLSLYLTRLGALQGLYDTHESTAEAFLVDLGTAETARINELYDSKLAQSLQDLTNRGLYTSALVTAVTDRNTLERNRELTQLNDRLAREKLDNEHKLYEQEIALNGMVLDGRLKYNDASLRRSQFLIETRKNLALTLMEVYMKRAAGRMDVRDREEKLMAYQLDTHNNLAIGLWNFIERRDDEYPSLESITKLVAGLGDAGGGWVVP